MNKAITFVHDKETTTKQRFVTTSQDGEISGSIYVSKEVAGDRKELTVTIS